MRLKNIKRLFHIRSVLGNNGLKSLLEGSQVPRRFQILLGIRGASRNDALDKNRGARIRKALEDLGPIFVKFGQTLSTRRDLLPDDIARELVKLQDRVPPFDVDSAKALIENALGNRVSEAFAYFEDQPLASASVAQVHAARLHSGEEVVVKVLRPGIEERIKADLDLLFDLAEIANRYLPDAPRLRPLEVVSEFKKTLLDELDLIREASNAAEIRRRFENSDILYIPRVYFDLTRKNVLVMEHVSGIPIGDIEKLRSSGVNLKTLAERGVEIFFTQVLRDSLFHADMHPGNIFATSDAKYIAIDFGIVGSISHEDKRYIAENFRAFFNRDYRKVAEMHIESGWVPRDTRVTEFEAAIRSVCEPIFEKPLKDISYGHLLLRLFQVARRFNMEVQPQLVLLQKTLLNIEGLGRELYPELDLWKTAKPFIENWFRSEIGLSANLDHLKTQLPEWAQHWPEMPMLVHRSLSEISQGNLHLKIRSEDLREVREELACQRQQQPLVIGGATLCICASLLIQPLIASEWQWGPYLLGSSGILLFIKGLLVTPKRARQKVNRDT